MYEKTVFEELGLTKLKSPKTGYSLIIRNFDYENRKTTSMGIVFSFKNQGSRYLITSRNIISYPEGTSGFLTDTAKQYSEVGCGLGEFIPLLANDPSHKKPIAIDPADFSLLKDMLEYSRGLDLSPSINSRVDELISRVEIIINPEKVHLVNMPLDEAIKKHPELKGIADIVIDNFGPRYYAEGKKIKQMENLEKTLLRQGGRLIVQK